MGKELRNKSKKFARSREKEVYGQSNVRDHIWQQIEGLKSVETRKSEYSNHETYELEYERDN